jgi:hypothetical protein
MKSQEVCVFELNSTIQSTRCSFGYKDKQLSVMEQTEQTSIVCFVVQSCYTRALALKSSESN